MNGTPAGLHRTGRPCARHVIHGEEVFVVLDGAADMHYRQDGAQHRHRLQMSGIWTGEE